jgi:predicted RNA binding protein YcfA (HicA-like mRNA interferase family)
MANNLNGWSAAEVIKFLREHGFSLHRSSGSHFHYKKQTADRSYLVTIAYYGSRSIPIGTMNSIVRQSGIKKEIWTK